MTTAERPKTKTDDVDVLARNYVQSLARGIFPEFRPVFGEWDRLIENLEMIFQKTRNAQGDIPKTVSGAIDTLCKLDDAFAALIQAEPIAEAIEIPADLSLPPLPEQCQLDPALARDAFPYLDRAIAFSKQASPEAYEDYHPMVMMWMLSVANARRSYVQIGLERTYGNLMIGLFGRSSLFAKSTTAKTAKKILIASGMGYLLGPDKPSPSKLLSNMAGNRVPPDYGDWNDERKSQYAQKIAMSGQKGLYFDELGKLLQDMLKKGSTTSEFSDLFLKLDGGEETYVSDTQARGAEPVEKPYLALLGSITPPNLAEMAKSGSTSWNDGLFGRMGFVAAPPDAYIDAPLEPGELTIPDDLTRPLRVWHDRLGVPVAFINETPDEHGKKTGRYQIERQELPEHALAFDRDAKIAWQRYRSALKKMIASFPHEDFAASYARLPGTALRMAVLMASLSESSAITLRHWAKAQELAEILRKGLHELYRQVNQSACISDARKLEESILSKMQYLKEKGIDGLSVAVLRGSYLKNVDVKTLTDTLEALVKSGLLKKETTNRTHKYSVL